MTSNNLHSTRLFRLFNSTIKGEKSLETNTECKMFLEAISIQPDASQCIERLVVNPCGLSALQNALRSDVTIDALNGRSVTLLQYIQEPSIKTLSRGQILIRVLEAIVEASSFWNALVSAFKDKKLAEAGQQCFAWTLLHLILSRSDYPSPHIDLATEIQPLFIQSPHVDIRIIGQKIKHIISVSSSAPPSSLDNEDEIVAGGRHDNDFVDFRNIAILPTSDELASKQPPFLRTITYLGDPRIEDNLMSIYLDNTFRLLREDMIFEMREELQILLGKREGKKKNRGFIIQDISLIDCDLGSAGRHSKWSLVFKCATELPQFHNLKPHQREAYLKDHPRFLKHQCLTALIVDGEALAFPTVRREEDRLVKKAAEIVLELEGDTALQKLLLKLKSTKSKAKLIQLDVALFAYKPILTALKGMKELPLSEDILFWKEGRSVGLVDLPPPLRAVVDGMQCHSGVDVGALLGMTKKVILDPAQERSLLSALTQSVSIIQGPPGTGKSFIGSLLAKMIHQFTDLKILVVCYTNHALDQFLEDLLDTGISSDSMVRIGGKSSARTECMLMRGQTSNYRRTKGDFFIIDSLKSDTQTHACSLSASFRRYLQSQVTNHDLLAYLETDNAVFYEAFEITEQEDGMKTVAKNGRAIEADNLIQRWRNGNHAGVYKNSANVVAAKEIWSMPKDMRLAHVNRWIESIRQEEVELLCETAARYNSVIAELDMKWKEKEGQILKSKRIIGCTTTAAAKYTHSIHEAAPDIILVEEAGEILESHIVTSLGRTAKQLILIGDHKQLRPKVNNYELTVEKGNGYNLNVSLFERLVLQGYPHSTLIAQHRMRPEISSLVRHLMYPNLKDAPKTEGRANIRGLQDNVIFINHDQPEDELTNVADMRDMGSKSSKQNHYEARIVLRTVKYLAQQGYGTSQMVVLTPYLGQLKKLEEELRSETDPVLDDLDSADLIRAGLLTKGAAKASKKKLRIATIDNYQGEESDIVIASLTRSNSNHDIGFMFAPERLNVLLSRARNCLILIGNSDTFTKSKKGGELWKDIFTFIKNHIYNGLPVKCERHPTKTAFISSEVEFDQKCPDGGCNDPCDSQLNCGMHKCPSKCHQISDHSKIQCREIIPLKCEKGHDMSRLCFRPPTLKCQNCERNAKRAEEKARKEFARKEKRDADEAAHLQKMKELEEKISEESDRRLDAQLAEERKNVIRQKNQDLQDIRNIPKRIQTPFQPTQASADTESHPNSAVQQPLTSLPSSPSVSRNTPSSPAKMMTRIAPKPSIPTSAGQSSADMSGAKALWDRKRVNEGIVIPSISDIMEMTGLEDVKSNVLSILSRIDVAKRQGVAFTKDRYSVTFLGNPGTGKTTVARHYAKFLSSVGVLSGSGFEETTGSSLSNEGVNSAKGLLERSHNAGGGVIFVDEAYQLTSPGNPQGGKVLEFLLAEIENNIGKIVFIFAGYRKEMEKFFEHNPGLKSRIPNSFVFDDYTDDQLRLMLEKMIHRDYNGRMKVEDGVHGLYGRISVRRLGRGRGCPGFGNARALENLLGIIKKRQASRISSERQRGYRPDDFLITREDLIGRDPAEVIRESESWQKLLKLTGLVELKEQEPLTISLNRTFLGSPGTGKTTVAKLYGTILTDLGLLSNGEVVLKNPSDFIGNVLGASESQTKAILASTVGKVLIIDEAYMLYGGAGSQNGNTDSFKTAVIDTLVAEVQSTLGEDRCVLLLGYEENMRDMFQNVNPGLSRRFKIEEAFMFEDFSSAELLEILDLKLSQQSLAATPEAKKVALEFLERAKLRPNFGNGGDVENLLATAKTNYVARTRGSGIVVDIVFEPQDFDYGFDRVSKSEDKLVELFKDVVGCEDIVEKLRNFQKIAVSARKRGAKIEDLVPTTFVFKGPPGTGKTTTARKMGEMYYNMGMLAKSAVHECSASDIVGKYVGHTGPLVRSTFEKARGQVLFIDEAYRLKEGHFAKEAIDEIVTLLTDKSYKGKIIVILAGYDEDINDLLRVNRGLSSRFTEEIVFVDLLPAECITILASDLNKKKILMPGLTDTSSFINIAFTELFKEFSSIPDWGNARDVKTLAQTFMGIAFNDDISNPDGTLTLDPSKAVQGARVMLATRKNRQQTTSSKAQQSLFNLPVAPLWVPQQAPPSLIRTSTSIATTPPATSPSVPVNTDENDAPSASDGRDAGVSDAVWEALQQARAEKEAEEKRWKEEIGKSEQEARAAAERREEERQRVEEWTLKLQRERDEAKRQELERSLKLQQEMELEVRRIQEKADNRARARKEAEEKARQQAAVIQKKLRTLGRCDAGFQWINMGNGYRCAGGSHFASNTELGI